MWGRAYDTDSWDLYLFLFTGVEHLLVYAKTLNIPRHCSPYLDQKGVH